MLFKQWVSTELRENQMTGLKMVVGEEEVKLRE
jgi:hypothetical protein